MNRLRAAVIILLMYVAVRAHAAFPSKDVFLPVAGRVAGAFGSQFYTTVWLTNMSDGSVRVELQFLNAGQANAAPLTRSDEIGPHETRRYDNIAETLFGLPSAVGALRVRATSPVVVDARVYNRFPGDPLSITDGTSFAGVPASFAIKAGQTTALQGGEQSADFRYNIFAVETSGDGAAMSVRVLDEKAIERGKRDYAMQPYESLVIPLRDVIGASEIASARVEISLTGQTGSVIVAGSQTANGSQDPSGFEMSFDPALLGDGREPFSLNGLDGNVALRGDGATTVTANGDGIITISSPFFLRGVNAGDGLTKTNSGDGFTTLGIARGAVVRSLNGLKDSVTLEAGPNVTIAEKANNTITISATAGAAGVSSLNTAVGDVNIAGAGGNTITKSGNTLTITAPQSVHSLNGAFGDVNLAAGPNVTLTPSGNTLTIGATATSAGVSSLKGAVGDVNVTGAGGNTVTKSGSSLTITAPQSVHDVNGVSGSVTLAAGPNVTLTPSGNTLTIGATAASAGVSSLNGAVGDVNLAAGPNVTVTPSGNTVTIAATPTTLNGVGGDLTISGSGGNTVMQSNGSFLIQAPISVHDLNGLTDSVLLEAGSNVTITPSGNTLTIAATPGSSGVSSVNGASGAITIGGAGGNTVTNSGGAVTVTAPASVRALNGLTDNVTLAAGPNVVLTPSGNTLTIDAQPKVIHDATLQGDGTPALPLAVGSPLFLSGATNVIRATATDSGGRALVGEASGVSAIGVSGTGGFIGVSGSGPIGVSGISVSGTAVVGNSLSGLGILASTGSGSQAALDAQNLSDGARIRLGYAGFGALGEAAVGLAGNGTTAGVVATSADGYGISASSGSGSAVYGRSTGSGEGVTAYATTGYAGHFHGNVRVENDLTVVGTLSKGAGSFKIDHPLDPENKYLYHSFVESPDMMNIYNGEVVLDANGEATIGMPAWFDALNRDFRYQLTCVGGYAPVYVAQKMNGNTFRIAGGREGLEVSWQVTGIRKDPYANAHRIPVEQDKPTDERGRYLHAIEYGQPADRSISALQVPPQPARQEQ